MKLTDIRILSIIIIVLGSCGEGFYNLVTVSPDKTYRIQLTEKKTEYPPPNYWIYEVFLGLEKNAQTILRNEIIYTGDESDARFRNIASEAKWISGKILKLSRGGFDTAEQVDEVEIHNDSGKRLTYLLISWTVANPNPNERFVLLDIEPGEKSILQVTSNETDRSSISCFGRFEDGKRLSEVRRSFRMWGICKPTSHYLITIKDDNALIESRECTPID
jgi:hypothetical protein